MADENKVVLANTDPIQQLVDPETRMLANKRMEALETTLLTRASLISKMIDDRRDYDAEAGYPDSVSTDTYKDLYKRNGLGKRVVDLFPAECWSVKPRVWETEDHDKTPFETAWDLMVKEFKLWYHLKKLDKLSGIGRFGCLLLGYSDGKWTRKVRKGAKLLYIRAFDEQAVTIRKLETRTDNPRFGLPKSYQVQFTPGEGDNDLNAAMDVHWERMIHVADGLHDSEVYGTPRMEVVINRIIDSIKVLSGSGEMFWRGGFPGYSFELMPGLVDPDIDNEALKAELYKYQHGMQRYLSLVGVTAKSLAPQVADPMPNYGAILKDITITLGVPMRIFVGSEEGQLAGGQDSKAWNGRVRGRQEDYLTPFLIRPFIDRMIATGVLPTPAEYDVTWPDRNTQTEEEHANVGQKVSTALQRYVRDNISRVFPLAPYLRMVLGYTPEKVSVIIKELEAQKLTDPEGLTPASEPAGLTEGGRKRNEEDEAPDRGGLERKQGRDDSGEDEDVTT